MNPFEYTRATSVDSATKCANSGGTFIAGGTNLLDLMKLKIMAPHQLIDINGLDLNEMQEMPYGGLRIGALVSNSDCAADPRIRRDYSVLSRAILAGASGQLRNKATMGGNLCQRTRCYYFYNSAMPCNKRAPGSGCQAKDGFNRIHAILGASDKCIATYPGDMAVALNALEATVEIAHPNGGLRTLSISDFHRLPGDSPERDNQLEQGELITAIKLPPPIVGTHIYRKVRDRSSYAFALVSVAAVIAMHKGKVTHASLAFGGLAHKPWRNSAIERMLVGESPSEELFSTMAKRLLINAKGHGGNDFKIPLVKRTLTACLREACRREVANDRV